MQEIRDEYSEEIEALDDIVEDKILNKPKRRKSRMSTSNQVLLDKAVNRGSTIVYYNKLYRAELDKLRADFGYDNVRKLIFGELDEDIKNDYLENMNIITESYRDKIPVEFL